MLFSVKLKNVAEDRRPHYWSVSHSYFSYSNKQVNSHYYSEACKTSFKVKTNIMLGEKVKWAFGQNSLIKGISSGKAVIVMCAG